MDNTANVKASSLRWKILRRALLSRSTPPDSEEQSQIIIKRISRRTSHGFNLIPSHVIDHEHHPNKREDKEWTAVLTLMILKYATDTTLTIRGSFVIGLQKMFLLTIACHMQIYSAATGASEVVISDGNPQVVDYTQRNIEANAGAFGDTVVKSMTLHWNQEDITNLADTFDIIIASDCTFFKDFHRDLARIVKHLLSKAGSSVAILLSPKRGNSLDLFLEVAKENGLRFSVTENYDQEVWKRHEGFLNEDRDSWPSYEKGHSYPLLIRITL